MKEVVVAVVVVEVVTVVYQSHGFNASVFENATADIGCCFGGSDDLGGVSYEIMNGWNC